MEIQEREDGPVRGRVWYRGRRRRQEAEYGGSRTVDVIHKYLPSSRSLSTATPLRLERYRLLSVDRSCICVCVVAGDDDDGVLERAGRVSVSIH